MALIVLSVWATVGAGGPQTKTSEKVGKPYITFSSRVNFPSEEGVDRRWMSEVGAERVDMTHDLDHCPNKVARRRVGPGRGRGEA